MSFYNLKTIKSGDTIEVYQYEKPVFTGKRLNPLPKQQQKIKKTYQQQKKYSFFQARNKIRRLINSNAGQYFKQGFRPYPPVFVTLTYKQNQLNRKQAILDFKNFIKRFNYVVYQTKENKLKYLAISENQQKRGKINHDIGTVHFHFVAFNLPFISPDILDKAWGFGRCEIRQVKKVKQIGAYISKYFSKSIFESKAKWEKLFFCSLGLKKPIQKIVKYFNHFTQCNLYEFYKNFLIYSAKYSTEYFGSCNYWQFCCPF